MGSLLFKMTSVFLLAAGSSLLRAQTNGAANTPPAFEHENPMISFLTPAQQIEYAEAHAKALADNPALNAEGDDLKEKFANVMTDGTPAEKQAFLEKMNSHKQKLRQAMLKEDPTLEPIFAEIDKHISEMKAKHLDSMQGSPSSSNASAAGSASH
jgi:hypothetical protein